VRLQEESSWWEIVLSPDVPLSLRFTIAITVILALLAIWRLIRPSHVTWVPWGPEARQYLAGMRAIPPAHADGLVLGEAEQAAIAFRRFGRVLLALGDPVGNPDDKVSAIWRFRDLAQQEGLDPAFWRANPIFLKVYGD